MEIINADILNTPADALILTVDGTKSGLEGNLARAFERRFPDDWKDMQRDVRYPIALGKTIAVPWDGDCPWKCILFASTLHHLDVHSDAEKYATVVLAFRNALHHAQDLGLQTLSTTVFRGGWRMELGTAFSAMLDAWSSCHARYKGPKVSVFVQSEADRNVLAAEFARRRTA